MYVCIVYIEMRDEMIRCRIGGVRENPSFRSIFVKKMQRQYAINFVIIVLDTAFYLLL
jgi:hypothetical protein